MSSVGGKRQFSAVDGYAALLERDAKGSGSEDLLAEERALAARGRWWKPWWLRSAAVGDWFPGRKGAWAAAAVLVALAGWLVYMMATGGVRSGSGASGPWEAPEDYTVNMEAGRVLRVGEVEVALAYGEPVELGVFGRPVVVHAGSGEERELTPLEVDFFEEHGRDGLAGVELGVNRVVWNPGPQGWGMWWREEAVERFSEPELLFTRERWREKQERELQWLAYRLEEAALVLNRLEDPLVRQRGIGAELAAVLDRMTDRYPSVREKRGVGAWAAAPTRWVCDEELELALTGGITQGCPGLDYRVVLSEVWGSGGAVYQELARLARLLNYLDGLSTEEYFGSGDVPGVFFGLVDLLEVEMLNLAVSVGELRRLSAEQQFFFSVEFFGDGGGS